MSAEAGHLALDRISRRYGEVSALHEVSVQIAAGEFVTLLGPSGSGKTTTLKIIAGFSAPDSGRVLLDGRDLTAVPPHRRDIGMVFQNYALFPHMSVAENIAFPLEMRRTRRAEIRRKVAEALSVVRMRGFEARRPRELSGGQQQRIALARALVFHPRLLLMDEPLGALDRKLREEMQTEIVRISRDVGITVVYVTHDQEEALAMSNRIAVYHAGRIEQVGTPEEIYERPASLFVADFIGESTRLRGKLGELDGRDYLLCDAFRVPVDRAQCLRAGLARGAEAVLIVRPEMMRIAPPRADATDAGDRAGVAGRLQSQAYLGTVRKYVVDLPGGVTALARTPLDAGRAIAAENGDAVMVSWPVAAGIVLPPTGTVAPPASAPVPVDAGLGRPLPAKLHQPKLSSV
jgi:putative spermidine/putrescine transport system ATP-binding protein